MYTGSCLCGEVRFQFEGQIEDIICCHCSRCRKAQGSAFATNGNVDSKLFKFLNGKTSLTPFESSPGHTKFFCKHCGSPIMSTNTTRPNKIRIRLGTLESDISERPGAHIFVDSKANWEEICDDLPQHKEFEPGR